MTAITVLGGTGYAGAAIVEQAVARGHTVTVLARHVEDVRSAGVDAVAGDATDPAVLASVIDGAEVVVAALSPRGPLLPVFRDVYRRVATLSDAAGARLYVVGGFSSLRPANGAPRFVSDLDTVPEQARDEVLTGAAVVVDDLPATPDTLHWVFVSPPLHFGSAEPGEPTGRYLLGDDVAVDPDTGGAISAADYARGLLDLVDAGGHRREHLNLGNPG